jgi:hypothetical protein
VHLEAEVTGGDLPAPVSLVADLPLEDVDGGTELVIDRAGPAELRLDVTWTIDGTLLDGLDLSGAGGSVALTDAADPAADTLLANLASFEPHLEVR